MKGNKTSFRVGRVRADLRGKTWYLTYHENGRRQRPRVGLDRTIARQLAAQINAQLTVGAPAALSFESISIQELQCRWLDHHEHILRSSLQTIRRYRAATAHLLRFVESSLPGCKTSGFGHANAEEFVRYLRSVTVSPNGHPHTAKRPLLDKGIRYVLECCRSLFGYASKRRHLSPYAPNPFTELQLDRLPLDNAKSVDIFTPEQEQQFLEACDDWQLPIFLTLMFTGLRPGELTHLLLPHDLDLDTGLLRIRNKSALHWQTKSRNERDVPLVPVLARVLRHVVGDRVTGPVFLRRRYSTDMRPPLGDKCGRQLELELQTRLLAEHGGERGIARSLICQVARGIWRDAGMVRPERIRMEFIRIAKRIGLPAFSAPKSLRHGFATCLQDANVDPIIRCELMGHSTDARGSRHGLGMTAVYTQTREETKRRQLERAIQQRSASLAAEAWLRKRQLTVPNESHPKAAKVEKHNSRPVA